MSSRGSGGSRYPSAYGHTPSYRSYNALGGGAGGLPMTSSLMDGGSALDGFRSDRFLDTALDRPFDSGLSGPSSSSSKKVSSYSSSYSSSSSNNGLTGVGGRPLVEYNSDSTVRSSTTGNSGIPHSSYSHVTSNYNSDKPYMNRTSGFSYNI